MTDTPIGPTHHLAPALRTDPDRLRRVERIATGILRRLGDDPSAATPTSGWVNPGWWTTRHVVRVSLTPGCDDLRREAAVAGALPPDVGYPPVVDHGIEDGHAYLVTRRIDAVNLRSVWPDLGPDARAVALGQLWERATHVHAVDTASLVGLDLSTSPLLPSTRVDASTLLDHLGAAGLLTADEHASLSALVNTCFAKRDSADPVLCHGDLYTGNALWDGNEVVALLDLEFAVAGPVEIDLVELAKTAFAHRITDASTGPVDPVERSVVDIARSIRADPSVLAGQAVLLEAILTAQELSHRPVEDVAESKPARLLRALADPASGHLASLVN